MILLRILAGDGWFTFGPGTAVCEGSVTGFVKRMVADRHSTLPSGSNASTCQVNSPPHGKDSIQREYSFDPAGKVITVPLGAVTTTTNEAASTFDSHEKLISPKLPKLDESGGASGIRQTGLTVTVEVTVCVVVGTTVCVVVGTTVCVVVGDTVAVMEGVGVSGTPRALLSCCFNSSSCRLFREEYFFICYRIEPPHEATTLKKEYRKNTNDISCMVINHWIFLDWVDRPGYVCMKRKEPIPELYMFLL